MGMSTFATASARKEEGLSVGKIEGSFYASYANCICACVSSRGSFNAKLLVSNRVMHAHNIAHVHVNEQTLYTVNVTYRTRISMRIRSHLRDNALTCKKAGVPHCISRYRPKRSCT